MRKQNLLVGMSLGISAGLAAVALSLIGNPTGNDTWSHPGPLYRRSMIYVFSHREPLSLKVQVNRREGDIAFGRIEWVWDHR